MLKLSEVNALPREDFNRTIGSVFEHSPWVAARSESQRPFANREELHQALCASVRAATEEEKLALIRAHPDLVGRAVLTSESAAEQESAGLDHLSPNDREKFREFNQRYGEKFGFPFVICARLNGKESILRAFQTRLENTPAEEIATALSEIEKIAELRLRDLIQ